MVENSKSGEFIIVNLSILDILIQMKKSPGKGPRKVREPIQVYLTADERALLDEAARDTGYSRAEILRRGLRSFVAHEASGASPMLSFLNSIAGKDLPADLGRRHDEHLAEGYLDRHDTS